MQSRRHFIRSVSLGSAALLVGASVDARADLPMLDEKDPTAVSLGYVSDTSKANQAKYPNHTTAQHCNNCQLFQGPPGGKSGPCPLYAGKQVNGNGWCSAYAKKG